MSNPDKNTFCCNYEDEGIVLVACGSRVSGKEWITVNGKVVSEKRNLKRKSLHVFEHNGHTYSVDYKVQSILKGVLHCVISKDDRAVKKYEAKYLLSSSPIQLFVIVGLSVIAAYFIKSAAIFFSLLALVVGGSFILHAVKARKLENYVEIKEMGI